MTTIEELEEENQAILYSDSYFDKYKIHKVCEKCGKDFKTKNKGAKYCKQCYNFYFRKVWKDRDAIKQNKEVKS